MDAYEKMIRIMRSEGSRKNIPKLILGEMKSNKKCMADGMELDEDDLYISEHLTERQVVEINIKVDSDGYVKSDGKNDKSEYIEPLEEGDIVLLYKISNEKYVIIDKVVEI